MANYASMSLKIDMDTRAFNKSISRFIKGSKIDAGKAIKKTAFDLLAKMLRPPPNGRFPVDSGRARSGFYASLKGLGLKRSLTTRINPQYRDLKAVERGKLEGGFIDKTKGNSDVKYVQIINNVHYILFLEYGHSSQSPLGFVRVSMAQMRGVLPKLLSNSFIENWNKY